MNKPLQPQETIVADAQEKEHGRRSWIEELPGIILKCMALTEGGPVGEGFNGYDLKLYPGENFEIETREELGCFRLFVIPTTIPITPLGDEDDAAAR